MPKMSMQNQNIEEFNQISWKLISTWKKIILSTI